MLPHSLGTLLALSQHDQALSHRSEGFPQNDQEIKWWKLTVFTTYPWKLHSIAVALVYQVEESPEPLSHQKRRGYRMPEDRGL